MSLAESLEKLMEERHPGEYELKWSLREHGYIVKDVSNNPRYWAKDIDLIATNVFTDVTTTIEVKWDRCMAQTGNMFIEIENPRSKDNRGWFEFCEADLLAYGDAVNKKFYFIGVAALRDYIEKNKENLQTRVTPDGAYGYLVPIANLTFDCIVSV